MKQLKTVLNQGLKNVEDSEIVDTTLDTLQAVAIIEDALKDGYQMSDFWKAFELNPIGKEIQEDFPEFLAEFNDLPNTADLSREIAKGIAQRNIRLGKVTLMAANLIYLIGYSHDDALFIYEKAKFRKEQFQTVLKGGSVLPQN